MVTGYGWRPRMTAVQRAGGLPGQTGLVIPGLRPDLGTCPGCRAPETRYCFLGCPLTDPHQLRGVDGLHRCERCRSATREAADGGLGILASRRIVHLPRADDVHVAVCCRSITPLIPLNGREW